MADLKRAVKDLVDGATTEVDPRALRPKVEAMLEAFDGAAKAPRLAAVKAIGGALEKADGRGAQVLALALGALVEGGAPPEAAWPSAGRGLRALLDHATTFANAVVGAAGEEDLDAAMQTAGAAVAAQLPREASAWKAAPARCLAAVACLARSKEVRAGADKKLVHAAWPLSDAVAEIGALVQVLGVVDDRTVAVVDREAKTGCKIVFDGLASNAELYILVAELFSKRIDAKVVAAVRAGEPPGKKRVTLPFSLGLDPDESPTTSRELMLVKGSTKIDLAHLPLFDGLAPDARIVAQLSKAQLTRALR